MPTQLTVADITGLQDRVRELVHGHQRGARPFIIDPCMGLKSSGSGWIARVAAGLGHAENSTSSAQITYRVPIVPGKRIVGWTAQIYSETGGVDVALVRINGSGVGNNIGLSGSFGRGEHTADGGAFSVTIGATEAVFFRLTTNGSAGQLDRFFGATIMIGHA